MTVRFSLSIETNAAPEGGVSIAEILEARAIGKKSARKRIRTRAKLLAVSARELEKVGYDSLTVDHLVKAAGIVRGTFYLHFSSRADIVKAILKKYWAIGRIYRPKGGKNLDLKSSIHRTNSYLVALAAHNPRLLEAREILVREDPEITSRMASVNSRWTEIILRDLIRRDIVHGRENLEFHRMKIRAVINMSDMLLADVPRLSGSKDKHTPPNLEMVVSVLDDLWYRSFYLREGGEA
ncbi:MAG: helix-turn-helix domain-containing protein [Salaquimonas sp.]